MFLFYNIINYPYQNQLDFLKGMQRKLWHKNYVNVLRKLILKMKPNLLEYARKLYLTEKVILADNFNVRKNRQLNLEELTKTNHEENHEENHEDKNNIYYNNTNYYNV